MCVTDGDVWNALFAIDSIFVCFDLVKVSRSHSAMIHGIVSEGSANVAYDFYYFTRYNCLVRQRTVHAHKLLLKTLPNHSFLQFTIKLFVRYGIHYRFPPIHIPRHTAMIHQPPFHRENIPNVTEGPLNYAFKRISRKSTVRKDKYKCNGFVYILQVIQQNVDCCCCTTATQPIQMPIAQLIVIGNVAAATKIIISEWSGLITFGRSLVLAALTDRNFSQVAIWLGMIAFQLRTTPTTLSRVHQHKHQLWCGV